MILNKETIVNKGENIGLNSLNKDSKGFFKVILKIISQMLFYFK